MIDDARQHRGRAGSDKLESGLGVSVHTVEHRRVAIDPDREAVAEQQLHLPEPDDLPGRTQVLVLATANSSSPTTWSAGRLAAAPMPSTSAPAGRTRAGPTPAPRGLGLAG